MHKQIKGSIIISNNQTLTQQFHSFCTQHKPKDFQKAVEFFAIFGGVEWGEVNTDAQAFEVVKKLILDDYTYIRNDISDLTTGMPLYHSILSGIAMGDGRTHSAFKKANVDNETGLKAVAELCEMGILKKQVSPKEFTSWAEDYRISDKLIFNTPFMRFWFAFISPLFKGIKEGNYKEVEERFKNSQVEFTRLIYTQLSQELLKQTFKDDILIECGSYWDKDVEIDIYAKTKSGKIIVGSAKYSNSKVKKSELTNLQQKCLTAKIEPDIYVISAKEGFSNELKSLRSQNLKLFTIKSLKSLI
nr:DUF234 domain-containing protein [uncultured Sulfurimonas sp.]